MNAETNFSTDPLDLVLQRLYEASKQDDLDKLVTVTIDFLDGNENYFRKEEKALRSLVEKKIIKKVKHDRGVGIHEDEDGREYDDIYFYQPECTFIPRKLINFLKETSRMPAYTIRRDDLRRIIINNEFFLTKTHLDRANDYFAEYIFNSPSGIIKREDIKEKSKDMNKRFHSILEDLKITPELRALFFPSVGKNILIFRKDVTKKDLQNLNIDEKSLINFLSTLRRI